MSAASPITGSKNKKKRNATIKHAATRCATWSHWQWPDLRLEHPQRVGEEGGSIKHLRHVVVIGEEAGDNGSGT
jgi:hypothetical protein